MATQTKELRLSVQGQIHAGSVLHGPVVATMEYAGDTTIGADPEARRLGYLFCAAPALLAACEAALTALGTLEKRAGNAGDAKARAFAAEQGNQLRSAIALARGEK